MLANSFRAGQGERTAVVVHGIVFELAAALFNVIWWYARRDRRLLDSTIDAAGVRSITRRFLLGLAWIGGGTLLGALLPLLGVAMFASFIIFFWLPISGEIGAARPRPVQASEWACPPRPARNRNLARTIPLPASNPRTSFAGARITNQRRPQSLSPGDAGNPGPGSPAAAAG